MIFFIILRLTYNGYDSVHTVVLWPHQNLETPQLEVRFPNRGFGGFLALKARLQYIFPLCCFVLLFNLGLGTNIRTLFFSNRAFTAFLILWTTPVFIPYWHKMFSVNGIFLFSFPQMPTELSFFVIYKHSFMLFISKTHLTLVILLPIMDFKGCFFFFLDISSYLMAEHTCSGTQAHLCMHVHVS